MSAAAENCHGDGFVAVAATSDVPPGWVRTVAVAGRVVALANDGGAFHAVDHDCSHAGGPLGDGRVRDGGLLRCPWHDAAFDVRTGEVACGPARRPLKTYPVEVRGTTVFVRVTEEVAGR